MPSAVQKTILYETSYQRLDSNVACVVRGESGFKPFVNIHCRLEKWRQCKSCLKEAKQNCVDALEAKTLVFLKENVYS